MKNLRKNSSLVYFLIILFCLILRLLIVRESVLEGWDESIYAQLGVEFAKHPDFFLSYNGEAWLEKPFLIGWITGLLHVISPYNTFLIRSIFSIVAVLDLYFVWQISKKLLESGSERRKNIVSLLSPIFVATTYLFLERATTINTDIVLVFGLLGYYLYKDRLWIKLIFLCIAVWSKSLLGFLPLVLDIILNFKKNLTKKSIVENILHLFAPSVWYIYEYLKFGNEFIQKHFVEQIFSRASTTLESHTGEWWFYIEYFIKTSPIAAVLVTFSLFYAAYLMAKKKMALKIDTNKHSPILAGILFFILISVSKSKLEWYLLPSLFLISPAIPMIWNKANRHAIQVLVILFGFCGAATILVLPSYSRNSADNIELIKIAECISTSPQKNVTLYQNSQNVNEYNILNDKGGAISSTFRYGGNPALIYYSKKEKVTFVYTEKLRTTNKDNILVLPKDSDLDLTDLITIPKCDNKNYNVFITN
jgi:hypothetical protein